MPPTLYLIDGHALAYRTYFALTGIGGDASRWITSSGEPTAVAGTGVETMEQARRLNRVEIKQLGNDTAIIGYGEA